MELAEVYRVVYKGPLNKLRGIIVSKDEENGYQYLLKDEYLEQEDINNTMLKYGTFKTYKDAHKNCGQFYEESHPLGQQGMPIIKYKDHILPNSHIESSIRAKDSFSVSLYLFGTVYENVVFEYPYGHPEKLSTPLSKLIVSEDGLIYLKVLYAIFNHAVEAFVKVTLTSNSHPFGLHGVISARTSAIEHPAYSSLIFYAERENRKIVDNGKNIIIPLSRDVVAVPLGQQLILEFGLRKIDYGEEYNEKGNYKMVENYLVFNALEDGKSTDCIYCSKGELKVEVTWMSRRKS